MTQITKFSDLGIEVPTRDNIIGEKIPIKKIFGKEITLFFYKICPSKYTEKGDGLRLDVQIEFNNEKRLLRTNSVNLRKMIEKIPKERFPVNTTIKEDNEGFIFT